MAFKPISPRTWFSLAYLLNALLATFLWVWYLSQGFEQPGLLDAYIDIQAHAIQKGRIAITPDHHHLFYHDAILYKGNYYFYWGILPAILHAFFSAVLGRIISSYLLVFLFLFLFFYFFQRIILEILRAASGASSTRNYVIACYAMILSWVLIFNLPFPYDTYGKSWFFGRFVNYEQQILFGLGLAMPGLFFLIRGYKKSEPLLLITAACIFAAAAWVRGTWFVFAALIVPVIYVTLMVNKRYRTSLKTAYYAFMMVPLLLLGGLLVLNIVRFDSVFDFGIKLLNPMVYSYLRIQNGLFSPLTQFYNTLFKALSYYTSPELIQFFALGQKSASWSENTAPYLFHNNPMMLPLIPLFLYGLVRALRAKRDMLWIVVTVGAAALVVNVLITYVGTIVIMRYFMECYYLTILLVLAGIVATIPLRVSVPILVLILGIHLPGNTKAFLETQPELRLIDIVERERGQVAYLSIGPARTFSIFREARWHEGIVATWTKHNFTRYNTLGMVPLGNGMLGATDLSVVYIKPLKGAGDSVNSAVIEFFGIQSATTAGRIQVYVEKTKVGEFKIVPREAQTHRIKFDYDLKDDTPYRLLLYFFKENSPYLPARLDKNPTFVFEAIVLSRVSKS